MMEGDFTEESRAKEVVSEKWTRFFKVFRRMNQNIYILDLCMKMVHSIVDE